MKCVRCRKEKDTCEFTNGDKILHTCNTCREKQRDYNKNWKQNNKEVVSLYNKHITTKKTQGKEVSVIYAKKIDTDEWLKYKTQREAAITLKLQPSNVNKVIKGLIKSTGGYTFKVALEIVYVEQKDWNQIKEENGIKEQCKGIPSRHRTLHEEKEGIIGKQCCTCKNWRPLTEYNKCKNHWDKLRVECVLCLSSWRKKNRSVLNENHKKYEKERKKTDPNFKLIKTLRSRLNNAIKRKNASKMTTTLELTGCTILELKKYLESKFKEGMTWQNHGEWHIDHIRPCSIFDLTNEAEQKKCFHYTNLQPLWASENLSKGNRCEQP
jgi:hypothetical protein